MADLGKGLAQMAPRRISYFIAALATVMISTLARDAQASGVTQTFDAFRAQMQSCWKVPKPEKGEDLVPVTIRVLLNPDGTLSKSPEVIRAPSGSENDAAFQASYAAALSAVKQCVPFKLPADKYEMWQEIEIIFDPREMPNDR